MARGLDASTRRRMYVCELFVFDQPVLRVGSSVRAKQKRFGRGKLAAPGAEDTATPEVNPKHHEKRDFGVAGTEASMYVPDLVPNLAISV